MARKTIAQLTAELEAQYTRVQQLERELHACNAEREVAVDALHRLRDELLASRLHAPQAPAPVVPFKIVTIRGEQFAKVPTVVGGRTVITYKPINAH